MRELPVFLSHVPRPRARLGVPTHWTTCRVSGVVGCALLDVAAPQVDGTELRRMIDCSRSGFKPFFVAAVAGPLLVLVLLELCSRHVDAAGVVPVLALAIAANVLLPVVVGLTAHAEIFLLRRGGIVNHLLCCAGSMTFRRGLPCLLRPLPALAKARFSSWGLRLGLRLGLCLCWLWLDEWFR